MEDLEEDVVDERMTCSEPPGTWVENTSRCLRWVCCTRPSAMFRARWSTTCIDISLY